MIRSRLSRASEEAEGMEAYDYLLVNDELEECVDELHRIISANAVKHSGIQSLSKKSRNNPGINERRLII